MGPDPSLVYEGQLARPRSASEARAVFGQTMGLVAFTLGFFALGAYVGRDLSGLAGIGCFIGALAMLFGLNVAVRRSEPLAIGMLFGAGLLLGMGMGPILNEYVQANPAAVWQAGGATALFVSAFGAFGYATRRDLSSWARTLFWLLLGLIGFGLVTLFVNIPNGHIIYAVLGLALFGAYTMFDFNRLRRAGMESAVPIAAGIFLDVVNVFQFFLMLFGGGRD
jgi:FtsH-binding integral membrane protein